MINFIGDAFLISVALIAVLIGANTLWCGRKGEVRSLKRMSDRVISRKNEPTGFWVTMATGLIWFLLGSFLLAISLGGMLGLL